MKVIAIDPGNKKSAMVIMDGETLKPLYMELIPNEELQQYIKCLHFEEQDRGAIEMLQSYGNLIGRDVLETAVWIGRFYETLRRKLFIPPEYVFRMEEKMHICHSSKAGDAEIRRALIDRFCQHDCRTGRGTKGNPDFFAGIKADLWAAYAVGLTYIETKLRKEQ